MSKFAKIETTLNKFILMIWNKLKNLFLIFLNFITPTQVKSSIIKVKSKMDESRGTFIHTLKSSPQILMAHSKQSLQKAKQMGISIKAKTAQGAHIVKNYNVKKDTYKYLGKVGAFLNVYLIKLKVWYVGLKPQTILAFIVFCAVFSFAGLSIYSSSKKILEEEEEIIAKEVIQEYKDRPKYYKQSLRTIQIDEINMPIYLQSKSTVVSLTIDFTLQTSNRYTKNFIEINPHHIQNQLNTTLLPVIPELPLSDEGKNILKEKLIFEINNLLKKFGIEGHIEAVYIHHLMVT